MKDILKSLYFDEKESELYLALLELSPASVTELLKKTMIERRTIYDVLERLIQKGYVSYFEEDNTRMFQPLEPELLLQELKEKQEQLKQILPQMRALQKNKEEANMTILKGKQGIKSVFYDIIASGEEHYALGDISPFLEDLKAETNKFLRALERKGMSEKILHTKEHVLTKIPKGEYRVIDKKDVLPTPTIIYGNTVVQFIFSNPVKILKITSEEVAKTHKSYFNTFWKLGKSSKTTQRR